MDDLTLTFSSDLWIYQGQGGWCFVTLPKDDGDQVKFFTGNIRSGWGSVKVTAKIADIVWNTSIFPDSKSKSYVLPVKADVRKKAKIQVGDNITIQLTITL